MAPQGWVYITTLSTACLWEKAAIYTVVVEPPQELTKETAHRFFAFTLNCCNITSFDYHRTEIRFLWIFVRFPLSKAFYSLLKCKCNLSIHHLENVCCDWKFQLIPRVQIVGILSLDRFAEQHPFEDLGCLGYHTIGVVSLRFLFVEGQATSAHSHATLPTYTFMTCWNLLSKSI
jgi:hypothetical protein